MADLSQKDKGLSDLKPGFKVLTFLTKETQIAMGQMTHVYNTPNLLPTQ